MRVSQHTVPGPRDHPLEEHSPVRIVIVSPPRSGNHWVECLLSRIYELKHMAGRHKPDATSRKAVRAWIEGGGFPDGSIFYWHRGFDAKFCDIIEAVPAHIVTVVRDPYDVFVSRYY